MNKNVKQHVIDNQKVTYKFYQNGSLWYETEKGLLFEVPISETGSGIFNREEKAINMMKWINKQLDVNDFAKKTCLDDVREKLKDSIEDAKNLNLSLRNGTWKPFN